MIHLQKDYTRNDHFKYLGSSEHYDEALGENWYYTLLLTDFVWLDHIANDPGVLDMFCDVDGKLKRVVTVSLFSLLAHLPIC